MYLVYLFSNMFLFTNNFPCQCSYIYIFTLSFQGCVAVYCKDVLQLQQGTMRYTTVGMILAAVLTFWGIP